MAISEQSRHELHNRLEAVLGTDAAATLMGHLPPVGWGDVATKSDLALLKAELRVEFQRDMASQTRTLVFTVIGSNLAIATATLVATLTR